MHLQRNQTHIHLLMSSGVLLLAFFFGIMGAFGDSIRRDELTTLGHIGGLEDHQAGLTLSETVESLQTYSQQHPPLFYSMANIWGKGLNFNAYILRIFALLWGMLALAIFYRLAIDLGGQSVALVAGTLMASSILFIFYTHEIRQYTLLIFCNTAILLLYTRFYKRKTPPKYTQLTLLTLATTCAIYTHNTSIFLLLVIGIYHLLFAPKTKTWWMISVAVASASIFYLPWLPSAVDGLQVTVNKLSLDDSKLLYNHDLLQVVPMFFGNGQSVLFYLLGGLGIWSAWQNRRQSRYLLFICVIFAVIVLTMNGYLEFIKRIRYLIVLLVPFYIFGAMGLVNLPRWKIPTSAFVVIWVISGTWFLGQDDYFKHTGLDGALDHPEYYALLPILDAEMTTDEILILVTNDYEAIQPSKQNKKSIEEYYLSESGITFIRLNSFPGAGEVNITDILGATSGRKLWISNRNESSEEQLEFLAGIADKYKLCKQFTYGQSSYLDYYIPNEESDDTCISS